MCRQVALRAWLVSMYKFLPLVNFITCIYTVIVEKYINRVEHISLAHSYEAIEHMNMHACNLV